MDDENITTYPTMGKGNRNSCTGSITLDDYFKMTSKCLERCQENTKKLHRRPSEKTQKLIDMMAESSALLQQYDELIREDHAPFVFTDIRYVKNILSKTYNIPTILSAQQVTRFNENISELIEKSKTLQKEFGETLTTQPK